jgi:hypothetical protein
MSSRFRKNPTNRLPPTVEIHLADDGYLMQQPEQFSPIPKRLYFCKPFYGGSQERVFIFIAFGQHWVSFAGIDSSIERYSLGKIGMGELELKRSEWQANFQVPRKRPYFC